jgi:hypothetical protein
MKAEKAETLVHAHYKQLPAMQEAAKSLLDCYASLASTHSHLLDGLLEGRSPEQWAHYPEDDVIDHTNGYQYFYHSHAPEDRSNSEHGHFHLFARTDVECNQIDEAKERDFLSQFGATPIDAVTGSLLCLSLNARGVPTKFFTVNRWVTGDRFFDAETTLGLLNRFSMTIAQPSTVNQFLAAMVQLFWPQIEQLLMKRDEKLFDSVKRGNRTRILEDKRTEILTSVPIDVDNQMMMLFS